jgi:hypothetical protein
VVVVTSSAAKKPPLTRRISSRQQVMLPPREPHPAAGPSGRSPREQRGSSGGVVPRCSLPGSSGADGDQVAAVVASDDVARRLCGHCHEGAHTERGALAVDDEPT